MEILVPISLGELFDKITILEIKETRITDKTKLFNISKELDLLKPIYYNLACYGQFGRTDINPSWEQIKETKYRTKRFFILVS